MRLPQQLQRAMATEAEAARMARAKERVLNCLSLLTLLHVQVIAAEGEHKASRALRLASEVLVESPAALQLRYLQTLTSISAENNSTIVLPVPHTLMFPSRS